MTISIKLFWLLVGHAVADYPLQGDFLAKAKNAWMPMVLPAAAHEGRPGVVTFPWWIAMAAHCLIHAGAVMLVTHSLPMAMGEFALHFGIDTLKCAGKSSLMDDQFVHVICKLLWAVIP